MAFKKFVGWKSNFNDSDDVFGSYLPNKSSTVVLDEIDIRTTFASTHFDR